MVQRGRRKPRLAERCFSWGLVTVVVVLVAVWLSVLPVVAVVPPLLVVSLATVALDGEEMW